MVLCWMRGMFFHSDCADDYGGIAKCIKREDERSIVECLSCGKRGYYPFGGTGEMCVEEIKENET